MSHAFRCDICNELFTGYSESWVPEIQILTATSAKAQLAGWEVNVRNSKDNPLSICRACLVKAVEKQLEKLRGEK